MKQTINSLSILFLAMVTSLQAEPNSIRGRYYLEGTYADSFFSPTKPYQVREGLMSKENNFENRGNVFGPYTTAYGNDLEKIASWYAFENAPKGKIESQSQSIFFEYIFQSGIGLGIGLTQSSFQAKDLSKTKFDTMFELGYLSRLNPEFQGYPLTQLIQYEIMTPYQTFSDDDFLHMRYASLQLAYHFLEKSIFDPYIRIGAGIGKERFYKANILQSNLTIGTRIFFSERLYLVLEAIGNNYDARKDVQSPKLTNLNRMQNEHIWSLQEYSAKVGVGVSF